MPMILESLFGLSLLIDVSLDTRTAALADPTPWLRVSVQQKDTALLPLVRRATDCIVRKAAADPRYSADMQPNDVNDLIVDSIAACEEPVRAMIDAHDRLYGDGSGEAFLLGPYLDVLPAAVIKQAGMRGPAR
jgi:hypothetical protein